MGESGPNQTGTSLSVGEEHSEGESPSSNASFAAMESSMASMGIYSDEKNAPESLLNDSLTWMDSRMENLVNIGRSRANSLMIDSAAEQHSADLAATMTENATLLTIEASDTTKENSQETSPSVCPSCKQASFTSNPKYCWNCGSNLLPSLRSNSAGSNKHAYNSLSQNNTVVGIGPTQRQGSKGEDHDLSTIAEHYPESYYS